MNKVRRAIDTVSDGSLALLIAASTVTLAGVAVTELGELRAESAVVQRLNAGKEAVDQCGGGVDRVCSAVKLGYLRQLLSYVDQYDNSDLVMVHNLVRILELVDELGLDKNQYQFELNALKEKMQDIEIDQWERARIEMLLRKYSGEYTLEVDFDYEDAGVSPKSSVPCDPFIVPGADYSEGEIPFVPDPDCR